MTFAWQAEQTEVTRVRIKTSQLDPLTAQRQVASALNSLSLHPAGLPASAILCIRTLPDPKPGLLRLPANDMRATQTWGQAVNHSIDQLARQAARPILGAVPAKVEAVLFADRSELLTCLALDWCAGEVNTRWWWQSLLRQREATRAVIEAWLRTPEHIPAALHQLAVKHQAARFAQKLTEAEARELALAVTRTFGLRELHSLIQDASGPSHSLDSETSAARESHSQNSGAPPWSAHVNEPELSALSLPRQLLIGVSVMVCRAPRQARSPTFAQAVQHWQAAINQNQIIPSITPTAQGDSGAGDAESQIEMRLGSILDTSFSPQLTHSLNERELRQPPRPQRAAAPPSGRETRLTGARRPSTATSPVDDTQGFGSAQEALPLNSLTPNEVEGAPEPSAVIGAVQPAPAAAGLEINTTLGGSLYLINLGLFLGLYGDFTTPLAPGIDLLIWDFVALLAEELLGDEVRADPLWGLLARLATRADDELPGADFNPPGRASLQAWLAELMHTLRPRLRLALGVEAEAVPNFLRAQARIRTTATRLDAFFSLAELPIAIRLSGLDRDPGWVPAAGRTIAFHFD